MSDRNILLTPGPYHIISYGTLLGTTFFHTFINGIVQFKTLPRPQFSQMQTKLFPIYFSLQAVIPALLALTYPGNSSPLGSPSGIAGVLDASNRWGTFWPLVTMFTTGLANLVVFLPATQKVMADRRAQEKKDGKRSYDAPPHSQEMSALNKRFGMLHGISTLFNLATFVASVIYGVTLSSRLS